MSVGAFAQANSQLERVLREGGGDDATRKMLVDVAMQFGLYPSAEHHLSILLDKAGNKDGALLEKLGTSQLLRGEYEKAKESLELAIKNSPNQLTILLVAGGSAAGSTEEPAKRPGRIVDEMTEKNPNNADAHSPSCTVPIARQATAVRARKSGGGGEGLQSGPGTSTRRTPTRSRLRPLASNARVILWQHGNSCVKSLAISPNVSQRYLQLAALELDGWELLNNPDDRQARFDAAMEPCAQGVRAIPEPLESIDLRWKLADFLILKRTSEETAELETLLADLKKLTGDVKKRPNVDATKVAQFEAKIAFLDASKLMS